MKVVFRADASIHIGSELFDEINDLLFATEISLIDWACLNHKTCKPEEQSPLNSNYLHKRVLSDSELDIKDSIENQFALLRVCDSSRFPAFFYKAGQKYNIRIDKDEKSK